MKQVIIGLGLLCLLGCGDGKLFDLRGERGDTVVGAQGPAGLNGLEGAVGPQGVPGVPAEALVYLCHVPVPAHHHRRHNMFVPNSVVASMLAGGDYLGECN